ncbi:hypothetical protein BD413DRAFT_610353 [Trametes elegans]|nr:hypothetical protein BD413DRAFT_610353 [Trametes elegans]
MDAAIAPRTVLFLSSRWTLLGSKHSLAVWTRSTTGVPTDILTHVAPPTSASIAQQMYWALMRETTRIEDEAYCLMGLFGVHVPTIYGEGSCAFLRLQEAILRATPDQSIFAWDVMPHWLFDSTEPLCSFRNTMLQALPNQSQHTKRGPHISASNEMLSRSPTCFQYSLAI